MTTTGTLRVFHVDAFARRVFEGNPAAVIVLEHWPRAERLAQIAEEHRLPETAFLVGAGTHWTLRWFTPTQEVPFCGHATVAAAHILRTEYAAGSTFHFATAVGELTVSYDGDAYALDVPLLEPQDVAELRSALDQLFPDGYVDSFRNFENVFVALEREADVLEYVPDLARIARLHPLGLAITARGSSVDFVSRYFAPSYGIPEDPVTGSTHATLTPYWTRHLGPRALTARQCSPRGGELSVVEMRDRVRITGAAVTYLRGTVTLSGAAWAERARESVLAQPPTLR